MTDPEHARIHATLAHLQYAVVVAAQVLAGDPEACAWVARNPELFGRLVTATPKED